MLPCMIFPRAHFKPHMINGATPETFGLATPSGWSNAEKFEDFLNHFIKYVRPNVENKVLLIMDNHESHLSIKIINLAKETGVVIFTFPPSYKSQLTALGPLRYWPTAEILQQILRRLAFASSRDAIEYL